jgi:hypothetical protein
MERRLTENSFWIKSTLETVSSLLAVIFGIFESGLIVNNIVLLTEIGTALTVSTVLAAHIVARYWKSMARPFAKWLLRALLWVTLAIAGNLFTYGYSLVLTYGVLTGAYWLAIYGVVVLLFIRAIKVRQYRLKL